MGAVWSRAVMLAVAMGATSSMAAETRVSGPYVHDNLTIFLVQGAAGAVDPSAVGTFVTLGEALASGAAVVQETGDVNNLEVRNLSKDKTLFIQAGDIVKGGQQDRVLSVDLVLPPGSEPTQVAAFCVEQGRWSARGDEPVQSFASSEKALAGKDLKLAAKSARSQSGVWQAVSDTQVKLAAALGQDATAPESPSSLQLTLENDKLEAEMTAHRQALEGLAGEHSDALGYVYAVNGRISGGDVYASPDLFRRLWPKLLEASITEAVAERLDKPAATSIAAGDAEEFLGKMDKGASRREQLPAGVVLVSRDSDDAAAFETRTENLDGWIHRSYVVK